MNALYFSLWRLSRLLNQPLDKVALTEAVEHASAAGGDVVDAVMQRLQAAKVNWLQTSTLDQTQVPALCVDRDGGFGILRGQNAKGQWIIEFPSDDGSQWDEDVRTDLTGVRACQIQFTRARALDRTPVMAIIRSTMLSNRRRLLEVVLGGVMINLVALATSLYTMQVYDRVVPTGAQETLLALSIGVVLSILFEFVAKLVRSTLNEQVADGVDAQLAKSVYKRFLDVRLDQLPASVGGLAAQLKGYETIRAFLVSVPTQLMVDMPFVLIYTVIVVGVSGALGSVPLVFMALALGLGIHSRLKVEVLTKKSNAASNMKTGQLVETVEGAETIKSGQGGWRLLTQWLRTADEARAVELDMRNLSEHTTYIIGLMHQLSYVLMVAWGAMMITEGRLTMGGLIACTILSGRILGPISSLPGMLVQWGHFRAALDNLSRIWSLEGDHHEVDHPIVLDRIQGEFECADVEFRYGHQQSALTVKRLRIHPGEKVAILGPVGSGKTTLLRLLTGMYKPHVGAVKLDGVDISHISKPVLAESMGYVQQDGRLFAGTLRENLVLGLVDPGDTVILEMAKRTGLHERLIAAHPKGLSLPIFEGGTGLSGGQRQLVNLTRVFLRQPKVWLLDEPTASMDQQLEQKVLGALGTYLKPEDTLCLVTHKPELLRLVDRVIFVVGHQIVADGPKDEVFKKLKSGVPDMVRQQTAAQAVTQVRL